VLDGGVVFDVGSSTLQLAGRNLMNRTAYPSGDVSGGVARYFLLAPTSIDVTVRLRR